jgi:16S rRNA (guanine966-N2)-methyltransferase
VKVIAGRWRGREIRAPKETGTRPSAARLREALFSAIQPWIEGAFVLDLFAGSGALGIEALSRGADRVEFVDVDGRALRAIAENLKRLGADPESFQIRRGDAWRLLDALADDLPAGAVVLLDPPYAEDLPARCLPAGIRAVESGRVDAFAVEHPANAPETGSPPAGIDLRRRRHGHGAFTLLTRSDA